MFSAEALSCCTSKRYTCVPVLVSVGYGISVWSSSIFGRHDLIAEIELRGKDVVPRSWQVQGLELGVLMSDSLAFSSPYYKMLLTVSEQSSDWGSGSGLK